MRLEDQIPMVLVAGELGGVTYDVFLDDEPLKDVTRVVCKEGNGSMGVAEVHVRDSQGEIVIDKENMQVLQALKFGRVRVIRRPDHLDTLEQE